MINCSDKKYQSHGNVHSEDDITKIFESCDWKTITIGLVAYVIYVLKCYGFNVDKFSNVSGGTSPVDIAATVIQKVITGERSWDYKKYPDIVTHLKFIAKSEISHVLNSWTNRKVDFYDSETLEELADHADNPEQAYNSKLKDVHREKLFKTVENELTDKPDLLTLFKAILDGCARAGELAQRFNVSVDEIYNRKKRLRRFMLVLNLKA